ncbi:cytochrome c [Chloroflexus sp.]|uniref:c-type cytochrome n=1 Tax=Chloroflexus sp. TaxID=1904827 RepID=UPI002ACE0711|nr:cytochrome c [Chloroflexus sp.]
MGYNSACIATKRLWVCAAILIAIVMFGGCNRPDPPDPVAEGQRLYTIYCLGCHSLDPAGPTTLGPPLAGIGARAANNREGLSAAEWLRREIVDPDAVLTPSYPAGLMPRTYGQDFRPAQIEAVVAYLMGVE